MKNKKDYPMILLFVWMIITAAITILLVVVSLDTSSGTRNNLLLYCILALNFIIGCIFWIGFERDANKDFYNNQQQHP